MLSLRSVRLTIPLVRRVLTLNPSHIRTFTSTSNLSSSDYEGKSAKEILEEGFKKMESKRGYQKSEQELNPLVQAGKELGIAENKIREVYEAVQVGSVPYERLTPEERLQVDRADVETFSVPPITEAHRPFEYDDLPSLGHLQLREHRVQREYNRIAAYDLPQLSKLASPYRPPSSDSVLRFKYNTFLGEDHPAAKKVTVQFSPSDLGLTDSQKHKLCLLAGTRYNSDTDCITISSSKFPQQAQNKRFIGDILKSLLEASRDDSESFADIPLETRHMEAKRRHNKSMRPRIPFPEAWNRPQDAPKLKDDILSVINRTVV